MEAIQTEPHLSYAERASGALRALPPPIPRAGVGAKIVRIVAKGFGTRTLPYAVRVLSKGIEAYNEWAHDALAARTRQAWLSRDLRSSLRTFRSLSRRDEALIRRVVERLAAGPDDIADEVIPEGVVFLRLAFGAGVLAGGVAEDIHLELDRFAIGLGLVWESEDGTLGSSGGPAGARGAIRCLDLPAGHELASALSEMEPGAAGRAIARRALSDLPDGAPTSSLRDLLTSKRSQLRAAGPNRPPAAGNLSRRFPACVPRSAPHPEKRPAPMQLLGILGERGDELARGVDAELERLVETSSASLQRATRFLVGQGGKRVRAQLVLFAAAACGGDPRAAVRPACLVEWLHQASLVVDDVLDEAKIRRGAPTLHEATSTPFSALVTAFILRALFRAAEPEPDRVRHVLYDCAVALLDGERMELRHTGDARLRKTEYVRIVEAKTARLFSCAATLGALAAGADGKRVKALGAFGRQAGIAFQIVDDLLDYVGSEAELGKRPGTDHAARKITLPVLVLAQRERCEILDILDGDFQDVRARMIAAGVDAMCLDTARKHATLAKAAISALPDAAGARALASLAERLVERRA